MPIPTWYVFKPTDEDADRTAGSNRAACPTCRRVYCRVKALSIVAIHVICEGCAKEGRT